MCVYYIITYCAVDLPWFLTGAETENIFRIKKIKKRNIIYNNRKLKRLVRAGGKKQSEFILSPQAYPEKSNVLYNNIM